MRETPKYSIQILYGKGFPHEDPNDPKEIAYRYVWSVWAGPQGVAVDPCNPGPFSFIRTTDAEGYAKDRKKILYHEITDPQYPNEASWSGVYPKYSDQNGDHDCIVKGRGEKGPAVLECGKTKIEFHKDVQFNDETMHCSQYEYHRAWTVEY